MADAVKHPPGGIIVSDLKSILRRRRTKLFVYGFLFAFVACTTFIAFSPSGSASPWFNNFFTTATASTAPYTSHFSSFFSHIFPVPSSPSSSLTNITTASSNGSVGDDSVFTPSLQESLEPQVVSPKDQAKKGGSFQQTGVPSLNQTKESKGTQVVSPKDQAKKGGTFQQTGVPSLNQTKETQLVSPKDQAKKGGSFQQIGVPSLNQTKESKETQVASPKDQAKKGGSFQQSGIPSLNQTKETQIVSPKDQTKNGGSFQQSGVPSLNQTKEKVESLKNGPSNKNQSSVKSEAPARNQTKAVASEIKSDSLVKNQTKGANNLTGSKGIEEKGVVGGGKSSNFSATLVKGNGSSAPVAASHGSDQKTQKWSIESMVGCDIFHGRWVRDDSYPLYREGSCPHIDEPFDCFLNGRSERAYQNLRWQPTGCNIPRLNGTDMLERLRGKRLVFVGDSLNRNMWESLVCILRNSVKDKRKVFEASGRHEFRTEGSYSFLFKDYNCTVEFFRSPFLVQEWEMPDTNGKKKETLRLDIIERSSSKYKDANVIIFNTGHWWTHEKTSKGKDYYQEGNRVYGELNVVEAFHKALNTWAKWVDTNVNPRKTLVFFRGYSASHFSGGQWNSGGQCDKESEPIKNEKYLSSYPPKMNVLESVIKGMKTPVSYLNITRMTDYRKDAHPSIYRKPNLTEEEKRSPEYYQDCSHWCLPGVPDSWNELVYAQMLIRQHQIQ